MKAALTAGWAPVLAGRRPFRCRPAMLPPALLLLALATLFLFGNDRGYFYRDGWHDWNSSKTLMHTELLSFRHNLLIFHRQSRDADGNPINVNPYSRFPLGGFALVRLATLPFGDTAFGAKIYAARLLLLLLFSAAAVLAYHALARISGSRWDALTAALLAFASYYMLYYADLISNEVVSDLFAVLLVFHGMVIFVQEGKFRQLAIKSCLALLLGWHVYALLLPFIGFSLAGELIKSQRTLSELAPAAWRRWSGYALTLLRSRSLTLGIITLLFGLAVLAFNLGNEYFALDRAVAPWELTTAKSAVRRFGGDAGYNAKYADRLAPQAFAAEQFYRIANVTLPYAINPYAIKDHVLHFTRRDYPAIAFGALTLGVCLVGLAYARRRPQVMLLLGTLTVFGFCWAVPLRASVFLHDFESVFYVGIPLTAFTLVLLGLRRMSRVRLSPILAVCALAAFIWSASQMAGVEQKRQEIAVEAEQMADYAAIRRLVADGAAVYIPIETHKTKAGGASWAVNYFLAGKALIYYEYGGELPVAKQPGDYLLLPLRQDGPALLTPENRHIFLYDWSLYDRPYRVPDLGHPVIAADWQVYLKDGRLIYATPECAAPAPPFFLHFVPRQVADLPAERQGYGFDNYDFVFGVSGGMRVGGNCVVELPLPEYDIAAIRTGQYAAGVGEIWRGEYRPPAP